MSDEDFVRNVLGKYYSSVVVEKKMTPHYYNPKKNAFSLIKQVQKYGRDKAELLFDANIKKQRKKGTLSGYIERYGENVGTKKYYEKNKKLSVSEESLKLNGYSDDEIKHIKKTHSKKSDSQSLEHFISNFGEDVGKQKYIKSIKNKKLNSKRCVEYWINLGHSIDDAKNKVSEYQSRGREYYRNKGYSDTEIEEIIKKQTVGLNVGWYIEKYGDEIGKATYNENCMKGSDINHYIEKYGDEIGKATYNDVMDKKLYKSDFLFNDSKIQLEFSSLLYDSLDDELKSKFIGTPITNKPFILNFNENEYKRKIAVPDIKIKNVFVEFDGTYWHSSDEAKARDIIRDTLCLEKNYITIRVDELTFKKNKIEIIQNTLKKIKEVINED